MGTVLDLQEQRRTLAAKRGFQAWCERFAERFGPGTTLADLSDKTLGFLIEGDDGASKALHDLVMGLKGLGPSTKFHFLENKDKMAVMEVTLYLLDQLRFEAMKRLGWVEDSPAFHMPILQLVEEFQTRFAALPQPPPPLSSQHPRFDEYRTTFEGDRGPFIRRLIPDAIKMFSERTQ